MPIDAWWPQVAPWVAAGWFAYIVALATWIGLQKREPIATLSWVLSLAALPVVGFLVYHFLGPRRIDRQRLQRARARQRLASALPDDLIRDDDCETVARLAQSSSRIRSSGSADASRCRARARCSRCLSIRRGPRKW